MTTLVALATKDALVMGCDSLGSVTRDLVDPFHLGDFFESQSPWKLKTDKNGKPILKAFDDIYRRSRMVPYDHMPHMTKLFPLDPLDMGVMCTGITSVGDRTIKSLINEFKSREDPFIGKKRPTNYTVKSIAEKLLKFIRGPYIQVYSGYRFPPALELMIGGYDKRKRLPTIYKIFMDENRLEPIFENQLGIAFGGQMQEIKRIVFGTDDQNRINLITRVQQLMDKYREFLQEFLDKKKTSVKLPSYKQYKDKLYLFKDWKLNEFNANWGDFSEQNAINCVHFFC